MPMMMLVLGLVGLVSLMGNKFLGKIQSHKSPKPAPHTSAHLHHHCHHKKISLTKHTGDPVSDTPRANKEFSWVSLCPPPPLGPHWDPLSLRGSQWAFLLRLRSVGNPLWPPTWPIWKLIIIIIMIIKNSPPLAKKVWKEKLSEDIFQPQRKFQSIGT